jgi:energy-coupling factor transport system ATP-binding protein
MRTSTVFPPVIGLGRATGWAPLPLSVRDARRRAVDLRTALAGQVTPSAPLSTTGRATARVQHLVLRRGPVTAIRGVDLDLDAGSVTAVMGRNGAGKSTLLAALSGSLRPSSGRVEVDGRAPADLPPAELVRRVGLVPQDPGVLLYAESVGAECRDADRDFGVAAGTTRGLLDRVAGPVEDDLHPRDLSEGQRLALALAVVLAGAPGLVLLDEPTRGLDYRAKERLVLILRDLATRGHTVVLATHDVELAAEVAERVVVLADGEVVADGPVRDVLAGSPAFAPQVAKIVHPLPFLTVAEVTAALEPAS